jgi:hypothetical protein
MVDEYEREEQALHDQRRRVSGDRTKLLRALQEIQALCAKGGDSCIQDVWRTANFAVHDATKRPAQTSPSGSKP